MSNLMLAKNYETNKHVPINSDRHGILWDKLRHERADARCYSVNTNGNIIAPNLNSRIPLLSLYNNSGSTVKIGVYSVKVSFSGGITSGHCRYYLTTLTNAPTGGNVLTPVNLKLGHSAPPSSVVARKEPAPQTTGIATIETRLKHISTSSTDIDFIEHSQFLDELIEIQANNGISIDGLFSTEGMNYDAQLRFVIIDEGDDI